MAHMSVMSSRNLGHCFRDVALSEVRHMTMYTQSSECDLQQKEPSWLMCVLQHSTGHRTAQCKLSTIMQGCVLPKTCTVVAEKTWISVRCCT